MVVTDCWKMKEAPGFRSYTCPQEYTQGIFLHLNTIRTCLFKIPHILTEHTDLFGVMEDREVLHLDFFRPFGTTSNLTS